MATELRQIRLRNWKCYRDQTVTLDPHPGKHIWILFGSNGAGKTSLLDAVRWCLYEGDAVSPRDLLEHFHRQEVEQNPSATLEVSLQFTRDGKTIQVSRVARRVPKGTTASAIADEARLSIDGVQLNNPRDYIASFLPGECSQFFFFDGVDIKKYAISVHKPETKLAIERVLGIPELRNLRDDAHEAWTQIEDRLQARSAEDKDLQRIEGVLDLARDQESTFKDQLEEAEKLRVAAKEILDSNRERAKQLEGLHAKLLEVTRLDRESASLRDQLNDVEEKVEGLVQEAPLLLLMDEVRIVAKELQSTTMTTQRRVGALTQLEQLVGAVRCLCGREMTAEAISFIRREIEQIKATGTVPKGDLQLEELRLELDRLSQGSDANFEALLTRRDRLLEQLDGALASISTLRKETGDLDVEEERQVWRRLEESEKGLHERDVHVDSLRRSLEDKRKEIGGLVRQREQLNLASQELRNLQRQTILARGLRDAAEEIIGWRIDERKKTIEGLTSDFYRRVTNKPSEYSGVEIRDDYTLAVRTVFGSLLNSETLSAGEKEALAYSFIAGLNLASENAGLFMMDTPFGHLDGAHQKNLVQSLTSISYQVIVLATDRDFPQELLGLIESQVAQKLEIRRRGPEEDASSVEVLS